jgi:hypothetical protein
MTVRSQFMACALPIPAQAPFTALIQGLGDSRTAIRTGR